MEGAASARSSIDDQVMSYTSVSGIPLPPSTPAGQPVQAPGAYPSVQNGYEVVVGAAMRPEVGTFGSGLMALPSAADGAVAPPGGSMSPGLVGGPAPVPTTAESGLSNRVVYMVSAPIVHEARPGIFQKIDELNWRGERERLRHLVLSSKCGLEWSDRVATVPNFRAEVSAGCRILHFTGHGMPGIVTFEDNCGKLYELPAQSLKELFSAGGGAQGVQLVFVSSCHSQDVGNAFVEAGVPHVVAVRCDAQVQDTAAVSFAELFYDSILKGKSVVDSFEIARVTVKHQPEVGARKAEEAAKFLLLGHGNHRLPVIFGSDAGACRLAVPSIINHCTRRPVSYFVGREKDVFDVYKLLHKCQCVTICGRHQLGKTELALKVVEFAADRREYGCIDFLSADEFKSWDPRSDASRKESESFAARRPAGHLVVVDGCNADGESIARRIVAALSNDSSDALKFLVTCVNQLPFNSGIETKQHALGPIDLEAVATLLVRAAPRQLTYAEMCVDASIPDKLKHFANNSAIVRKLEGSPGITVRVAHMLGSKNDADDQNWNLKLHESQLLNEEIPRLLAYVHALFPAHARSYSFSLSENSAALADSAKTLLNAAIPAFVAPTVPTSGGAAGSALPPVPPSPATSEFDPIVPPSLRKELQRLFPGDKVAFMNTWYAAQLQWAESRAAVPTADSLYTSAYGIVSDLMDDEEERARMDMPAGPPIAVGAASYVAPPRPATFSGHRSQSATMRVTATLPADVRLSDPVGWTAMQAVFQAKLKEAGFIRPLSPEDLAFIRGSGLLAPTEVQNGHDMVTLARFRSWWPKMVQWMASLQHIRQSWEACHVVGWISKAQAEHTLRGRPEGTFLLRFSESQPGSLAVTLARRDGACTHHLIIVSPEKTQYPFCMAAGPYSAYTFQSLAETILVWRELTYLYPDRRKDEVFGRLEAQ